MREIGQLIGPAVAAGLLLFSEPELVLALNAVTFAASAVLMTRLRGHVARGRGARDEDEAPCPRTCSASSRTRSSARWC